MFRHIFSFVVLIAVLSFVACEGGWVYECPEIDSCPTCMTDQYCHTNDVIEDVSVVDVPMVDVGKDIPNDVAKDVPKDIVMEDHCPWHCPEDMGHQTDVGGQDLGQDDSSVDSGESECQTTGDCYQYINGNPSCIMAGCQVNNGVGKCYFYERENFSPCGGSYYCYDGECIPSNCDDFNNCTVDFLNENNNCVHEAIEGCCNTNDDCNVGLENCPAFFCENNRCVFDSESNCYTPAVSCSDDADCVGQPRGQFCVYDAGFEGGLCQACVPDGYAGLGALPDEGCAPSEQCWVVHVAENPENQPLYAYLCAECVDNYGCDDGDPCTKDTCDMSNAQIIFGVGGQCQHSVIDDCHSCTTNVDCFDESPCTIDRCVLGKCYWEIKEDCCNTNDDCNVGLGCKAFSCENYECIFDPEPNCMPPQATCEVDADCVGKPYGPYCVYSLIDKQSYCVKCLQDVSSPNLVNAGCNEEMPYCYWGIGTDVEQTNFSYYWCAQCAHEGHCDDNNACTKDICDYRDADYALGFGAICRHEMMDGCQSCRTVVDCEDNNPCTIDSCVAGKCNFEVIESCCAKDADCASLVGDDCENFACVENACECLDNNNPLIQCEIACPTKYPFAVVWYASRTTYLENKPAVFSELMNELCTWAPDFPIFEFNCTNAVDIWADGNTAVVKCNYPFVNNPHPVEGDYGKRVISFPSLDCSP